MDCKRFGGEGIPMTDSKQDVIKSLRHIADGLEDGTYRFEHAKFVGPLGSFNGFVQVEYTDE